MLCDLLRMATLIIYVESILLYITLRFMTVNNFLRFLRKNETFQLISPY